VAGRSKQTRPDDLRSLGLLLAVALMVIAALQSTEIPNAIDAALRSAYYRVARPSETTQRVVLVEADEDTVRAWGEPVWDDERRHALLQRIAEGRPAAVILLDRERTFASAPTTSEALSANLTLVDLAPRRDPGAVVDALDTADLATGWQPPVMHALGLPPLPDEPLRIHYSTPVARLPSVAFHRIAQGDVPSSTFEGKVVVMGLTSLTHRDALATPVGALTTPEIFSHALAMLADGRRAYEPTWPERALALAGLLVGLVLALRTATPAQALGRAVGIAAGLVLADLLAFATGVACWGVGDALLLVPTALLVHWYLVQRDSAERVKVMLDQLGERSVSQPTAAAPQARLWRDMAELVQAYLEIEMTAVIAELPPGRWQLEPRAFMGMTEDEIFERQRDVRRSPYRSAFLTQRATRCDRRFVSDPHRYTIAVPLAYHGQLLGMWMVNLAEDVVLAPAELEAIEQLGIELGRSIAEARRAQQEARAAIDTADVTTRISRLRTGMEALGEDNQQLLAMLEALPLGLLVADVWGHVLQRNGAVGRQLALTRPEGVPGDDLHAVLSAITDKPMEGVRELMREVVREGKTLRLHTHHAGHGDATFLLMPMRSGASDGLHAASSGTTRLVLIAVPDALGERVNVPLVHDELASTPARMVDTAPLAVSTLLAPMVAEHEPDRGAITASDTRKRKRRRKRRERARAREGMEREQLLTPARQDAHPQLRAERDRVPTPTEAAAIDPQLHTGALREGEQRLRRSA
jgi:CHASE2 domain